MTMRKRSTKILDPTSDEVDEDPFSSPSSSDNETGTEDISESEDIIQQRVQLFKAADKYRRKPTLQLSSMIGAEDCPVSNDLSERPFGGSNRPSVCPQLVASRGTSPLVEDIKYTLQI